MLKELFTKKKKEKETKQEKDFMKLYKENQKLLNELYKKAETA